MIAKPALAAWGSGALVVAAAAVLGIAQLTAGYAPATSNAAKIKPAPPESSTSGRGSGNNGNGVGNGPNGAEPAAKSLIVSAVAPSPAAPVVAPVAPGVPATLTVRVENPNNQAVILTAIVTTVSAVTKHQDAVGDCLSAWFQIDDWTPAPTAPERIQKNAFKLYELAVTFDDLASTNQDGCKRASYSFTFRATANQA